MGQLYQFEHTIKSLHRAALDDAGWPEASGLIDEVCGSTGNFLAIGDEGASGEIQISLARVCCHGQRHAEWEREYFEVFHPLDERIPRLRLLPHGKLVPLRSLYTKSERKTSAAFNDAMPRANAQNGLNTRLELPQGAHISWQFADPTEGRDWSSHQTRMIERLMPHVQHFARVRRSLVEAQAISLSLAALLDNNRIGVVQLSRLGRIAEVNDSAAELLRAGVGLRDEDGFLRAAAPDDNQRLMDLVAGALAAFDAEAVGGSMKVTRSTSGPPLAVHVTPVMDAGSEVRPGGVVALALIVDTGKKTRIDQFLVAEALGLTPTEAEVASRLAEGMTPRQVAAATGRGEGTVRWHLHRIFVKLRLERQAELVRLVLALSGLSGTPGPRLKP